MKERMKKWLRPALFALGGALVGLAYYALVGCSSGTCIITSSPFSSMAYMALVGLVLSGSTGLLLRGKLQKIGHDTNQPQAIRLRLAARRDGVFPEQVDAGESGV